MQVKKNYGTSEYLQRSICPRRIFVSETEIGKKFWLMFWLNKIQIYLVEHQEQDIELRSDHMINDRICPNLLYEVVR